MRGLLDSLRSREIDGKRRRLYASAGDTYSVQVYVHVRPNGVRGLEPGVYYHRPDEHVLQLVTEGSPIGEQAHFRYNRDVFTRAGFELYLISEPRLVGLFLRVMLRGEAPPERSARATAMRATPAEGSH